MNQSDSLELYIYKRIQSHVTLYVCFFQICGSDDDDDIDVEFDGSGLDLSPRNELSLTIWAFELDMFRC